MKQDRFEQEVEKHKRRRLWRNILIAVLLISISSTVVAFYTSRGKPVKDLRNLMGAISEVWASPDLIFSGGDKVNVVLMGVDVNYDRRGMPYTKHSRSDTILLVSFDRLTKDIAAISIPRDTVAYIPGYYVTKINAANAFGGPELLLQTLRESLGIQVDYYIRVKIDGFRKAVDAVGGVDLEVEKNMDYDDEWAHLHIHLRKGVQHLDGEKAHEYVRFRHDAMGDIGRVARQQKLMKALAKKMLSSTMVTRIPKLIGVFQENVETNLTTAQLMSLGAFAKSVNPDAIHSETLPGTPRGGYWLADRSQSSAILSRVLGNTFDPGVWEAHYARAAGRMRPARTSGASHATEPPLEPTAKVPPPTPTVSRSDQSANESKGAEEPLIISPTDSEAETTPSKTPKAKSQPLNPPKPSAPPEAKSNHPADTGQGSSSGTVKSGASGKSSTGSKSEPPSQSPDRNIPPPATGDN